MKIYKLTKKNRYTNYTVVEYYTTKEKAEKVKTEIVTIYENAENKEMGGHWGKVIWEKNVYIDEIEVIE